MVAALNAPQIFAGAGVQVQFTPPFAESFDTVAATATGDPPMAREAGGAVLNATEITGGGGVDEPPPQPLSPIADTTSKSANLPFIVPIPSRALVFEDTATHADSARSTQLGCNTLSVGKEN